MSASDTLSIYFLDVGQGDCTFVVPPRSEAAPILFDCADQYVAERFVANHGFTDLSAVVVSHFDVDHVRGMHGFLRGHFEAGRRVDRLVMFPDRVPKPDRNTTLRTLMSAALGWEQQPPHAGFAVKASHRDGEGPLLLASGADWQVELVLPWLATAAASLMAGGNDPNECSAVLRVTRDDTSVLIGGDAPLGSWERLEQPLQAAHVIRVPHHGGEIGSGTGWRDFEDLYDAVGAKVAAISVGTNNQYGHPLPKHARAAQRGGSCRLLCTQLTPRCHDDPTALRDQALRYASAIEYPYRHERRSRTEVPCAGTVAVALEPGGHVQVLPEAGSDHDRLLQRIPRRLCRVT